MSDTAERVPRAGGASIPAAQLGAELRARRQSLGWELPDLAGSLRIRQPYLEAIEAGRIADLPGTTYALGFVRAYASALGLPGEEMASRFRAESADATARPALSFPAPVPQRGVPAGALMLLGLLILAGAYGGWYYVSEHQRTPAETVPPIPDHLLPHAAEKATPSPQVASILPTASAPAPAPPAATPPPPVAVPASQPPSAPTAVSSSPVPTLPAPASPVPAGPASTATPSPLSGQPSPGQGVQPGPASAAVAGAGSAPPVSTGPRIVVKATGNAWVTIKPKAGPAVFNRLMHAGDSWSVPPNLPGLLLTTGNAGATTLTVDNTPVVQIGPPGTVFRELPLDADMLKTGHLPPSVRSRPKPVPVDTDG